MPLLLRKMSVLHLHNARKRLRKRRIEHAWLVALDVDDEHVNLRRAKALPQMAKARHVDQLLRQRAAFAVESLIVAQARPLAAWERERERGEGVISAIARPTADPARGQSLR